MSSRRAFARALIIAAICAVAIVLASAYWFQVKRAERHQEAVKEIEEAGGKITWDCLTGFRGLSLAGARLTDASIEIISAFKELSMLNLNESEITNRVQVTGQQLSGHPTSFVVPGQ
jgi:hypothetical protein